MDKVEVYRKIGKVCIGLWFLSIAVSYWTSNSTEIFPSLVAAIVVNLILNPLYVIGLALLCWAKKNSKWAYIIIFLWLCALAFSLTQIYIRRSTSSFRLDLQRHIRKRVHQ